jgi:hypothetical protein
MHSFLFVCSVQQRNDSIGHKLKMLKRSLVSNKRNPIPKHDLVIRGSSLNRPESSGDVLRCIDEHAFALPGSVGIALVDVIDSRNFD